MSFRHLLLSSDGNGGYGVILIRVPWSMNYRSYCRDSPFAVWISHLRCLGHRYLLVPINESGPKSTDRQATRSSGRRDGSEIPHMNSQADHVTGNQNWELERSFEFPPRAGIPSPMASAGAIDNVKKHAHSTKPSSTRCCGYRRHRRPLRSRGTKGSDADTGH